jgi:hypothetical protein
VELGRLAEDRLETVSIRRKTELGSHINAGCIPNQTVRLDRNWFLSCLYLRWVLGQIALNLENNCRDLLADDFKKSGVSPFGREQDVRTMLLKKG